MNCKKLRYSLLLMLVVLLCMPACREDTSDPMEQAQTESTEKDNKIPPTALQLSETFDGILSTSANLSVMDEEYLLYMMEIDPTGVNDWIVKVQTSGTQVDQYGIFVAQDNAQAESFGSLLQAYLERTEESWAQFNYLPEELPKLENAKVSVCENYVIYLIAADSEQSACIKAFEEAVK